MCPSAPGVSGIIFVGKTAERSVTNAANTSPHTVATDQLMSPGFSREMPRRSRNEPWVLKKNHQQFGAGFEFSFCLLGILAVSVGFQCGKRDEAFLTSVQSRKVFYVLDLPLALCDLNATVDAFYIGSFMFSCLFRFYAPFIHLLLFKSKISQVLYNLYWLYCGLKF